MFSFQTVMQVCLAGGKRLEVNTHEMASKSREAETKDKENEVRLKTPGS